jgi:hypothetical protein
MDDGCHGLGVFDMAVSSLESESAIIMHGHLEMQESTTDRCASQLFAWRSVLLGCSHLRFFAEQDWGIRHLRSTGFP